jgi:molecular chaperone GrpE
MSKKKHDNPFRPQETDDTEQTAAPADDIQEKYETLNQQYVRLAADFDNYRKRVDAEREELLRYGTENALAKMLEVLDNFERGAKSLENVNECDKIKESFELIYRQAREALQKLGLEVIETDGKEFDPNFHEAVMQTPTQDYPEHTIINELQKGYKYKDKVLRCALVNVATT